jgi:lipoprotein-releasing system ATP-binding protein
METKILEAIRISKTFHETIDVTVLEDINFSILKGQFASIIGKSGCGKSTLLYILSTMDTHFEGDLMINGVSMKNKLDVELAKVRNENIGFVFQFHYLLNEFSVLQNVMLPGLKLANFLRKK